MRGINYQAGLGTIFIAIGFFCFKALLQKHVSTHSDKPKLSTKIILLISGIASTALGILLIIKAVNNIGMER